MRSIAARLLLGNGVVLATFVVLTALAVSWSVHSRAETARLERLQGLVYGILGATELTPEATLVVADGALPERTLAQPVAGLYAELVGNGGTRLWQSRSSVSRVPAVDVTPIGEWVFERLEASGSLPAVDRLQLQSAWELGDGEELPFVVHVVDERGTLGQELARFDRTLWVALGGAALLLLAVQTLVLRRGLAPLVRIGEQVREIECGERDALDADMPRELVPLAGGLNALLASERGRRERYRNLLDDLAHSLKTPLTILGNLVAGDGGVRPAGRLDDYRSDQDRLDDGLPVGSRSGGDTDARTGDVRATIAEQTARMRASIERSLERAAPQGGAVLAPPLAVRPVVERLARSLAKLHPGRAPDFAIDVSRGFTARMADADLHELLGNVLENACKYGASSIRVSADGRARELLVDDDGPGFPEDAARLARRGERADTRLPGEGLGLAASRELLESHGGTLGSSASRQTGGRAGDVAVSGDGVARFDDAADASDGHGLHRTGKDSAESDFSNNGYLQAIKPDDIVCRRQGSSLDHGDATRWSCRPT